MAGQRDAHRNNRWASGIPGLDGSAAGARGSHHHAGDEDDDHRADDGGDDRRDVERAVDRVGAEQRAGEEASDEGADDAEHDVPDDTQALVTADQQTREITGDRAQHDPRNDAHAAVLRPRWLDGGRVAATVARAPPWGGYIGGRGGCRCLTPSPGPSAARRRRALGSRPSPGRRQLAVAGPLPPPAAARDATRSGAARSLAPGLQ